MSNVQRCPKCNGRIMFVHGYAMDWSADDEPFEHGVFEDVDVNLSTVEVDAGVCEKCDTVIFLYDANSAAFPDHVVMTKADLEKNVQENRAEALELAAESIDALGDVTYDVCSKILRDQADSIRDAYDDSWQSLAIKLADALDPSTDPVKNVKKLVAAVKAKASKP